MKKDSEILSQVFEQLASDGAVDADRVTVGVAEGVVTLQGVVAFVWQKAEAETRVRRIHGVIAIANQLIVELPTEHERDDGDIARDAAHILAWHSELPKTIQVSASNGWLTLSGSAHHSQKAEAERSVRSIPGIRGIVNDIDATH